MIMKKLVCLNINPQRLHLTVQLIIQSTESTDILDLYLLVVGRYRRYSVNVRLLSGDKKNIAVNLFSKLGWELGLYYASYDDFHPDILARMYT